MRMIDFGINDPREMPLHFFFGVVHMDYRTAVRARTDKQNCSICPRYWYVDATFVCERCAEEFTFTAQEQRLWYEEYRFWVDSIPKHCLTCRRDARHTKVLRQEYDRHIAEVLERGDLESRKRLAAVIDRLCEFGEALPARVHDNRRRLAEQIARAESRR